MTQTIGAGGKLVAALVAVGAWAGIARAGSADAGKALYDTKCKVCHKIGSDAGKMADKGGSLDGVGSKRDAKWLKAYLSDPKSAMPDAKMPKMALSEKQLDDLVEYMLSLK